MSDVVVVERRGPVAVVTLNRPEARNALSSEMIARLTDAMASVDADDGVATIILTGADPAFCAGLDLKELGATGENLKGSPSGGRPWARTVRPVIGAINGPAVTGGLEIALACDFLVASERASFADTHARVGILPGWGLSVLLPQAIGLRRAKEMSLTGNFLGAADALAFRLVNHVVPHGELLPFSVALGADIASNDWPAVQALLASYDRVTSTTVAEGLRLEVAAARDWLGRGFDPADVERRRAAIMDRGRRQTT